MKTVTTDYANRQGYVPITTAYTRGEKDLLERAVANLGKAAHLLVMTGGGIEIWRKREEVLVSR